MTSEVGIVHNKRLQIGGHSGSLFLTAIDFDGRLLTGGSPVATPFLCFAKEKEAKKGDRMPLPLRGSRLCVSKNGKCPKLATLRHGHFLSIFCNAQSAASQAEILKSNSNPNSTTTTKHRRSICTAKLLLLICG
jgi:hypothetical protein